jgi:hypothetical protein
MRVEIRQLKSLFTFWLLNKSPDRDFDLKMLAGKLWFLIPYQRGQSGKAEVTSLHWSPDRPLNEREMFWSHRQRPQRA